MELFQRAAEQLEKEYRIFLDYLNSNEVRLSMQTGFIGKKDCLAINQLLNIVSERYFSTGRTQDYYTVIDFFYFVSVRSGILQIVKGQGKNLAFRSTDRYQTFWEMSLMERYIFMLAMWIGDYQGALGNSFSLFSGLRLFERMGSGEPGKVMTPSFSREMPAPWGSYYIPEIRLFALFKLIEIEWLDDGVIDKENKYRIHKLYQTAEGLFLMDLLKKLEMGFWQLYRFDSALEVIKDITGLPGEDIIMKLMHFYANPVEAGHHTISLRVEVGSCVRTITLGDQCTLDDLHYFIQKSVDFDMDHLYYFQIGKGTSMRRYYAPECDDESWLADTVSLAELSLIEGMHFEYLFDFGDMWRFQIYVEQILPEHSEEAVIDEVKGEAPEQYAW